MLMTTGNTFDGYRIEKYLGVISKEIIFRSGLGSSLAAGLENIVRSFSLRDVEMTGSSELIAKAKGYLMEQFEKEASFKGANAILGIDIETSFGTDLARVGISGTAVLIVKNQTDGNEDGLIENETSVDVHASNLSYPFTPYKIHLTPALSGNNVSLEIIITDKIEPGDIKADLLIRNQFEDEIIIENICFMGLQSTSAKHYVSKSYPITIPEHISRCIKVCNVIVKKYFCNGELCAPDSFSLRETSAVIEEMKSNAIGSQEIFDQLSQLANSQQMLNALENLDLDKEGEPYLSVSKALQERFQIERLYGSNRERTLLVLRQAIEKINN